MSVETRGRDAAAALRAATRIDAERGLARLRRTHRRRSTGRVLVAVAAVAGIMGAGVVVLDGPGAKTQPADETPTQRSDPTPADNGIIIDSIGGDPPSTAPTRLPAVTDTRAAPYPVWAAFDQDSSRFLFGSGGPAPQDLFIVHVLEPGLDQPVARIHCRLQCPAPSVVGPNTSFGPGPNEVTLTVRHSMGEVKADVYGFDGSLREVIDLSAVLDGSGIAGLAWSPDGSRLAVSTFTGSSEPYCSGVPDCAARVWIIDPAANEPELLLEQRMPQLADPNPPLLTHLAWSPDGGRLGLLKGTYYPDSTNPPQLLGIDVASGRVNTLYEFDDCGTCNPHREGFAWSPDGTRIAVTSGAGITKLATDGTLLVRTARNEGGPLAWLPAVD